ncbi:MAG: Cna B-type domain-containing protein [Clostridia bacterium]|nr:Cna B-type domain-containing protein [Clostridia bacterium]
MDPVVLKDGIFYDLLPGGTEVDPSTVRVINGSSSANALPSSAYSVSFDYDWQATGQTMMMVEFHQPEEKRAWSAVRENAIQTIQVTYTMTNSYDNIRDRGINVVNTVGYLNLNEQSMVNAAAAYKLNKITFRDAYQSLYDAHPNDMLFTQCSFNFKPVGVKQTGYSKMVKSDTVNVYSSKSRALPGDSYRYWIGYTTAGNTTADRIVIYDELETYVNTENGTQSEWQGVLTGVDIGAIKGKVSYYDESDPNAVPAYLAPVVYYSTQTNPVRNVDDSSVWTSVRPANLASVKAIAIDCRYNSDGSEFRLGPSNTGDAYNKLNIYVTMKAPTDSNLFNKTTMNESVVTARTYTGYVPTAAAGTETLSAHCQLTLVEPALFLHKWQGNATLPTNDQPNADNSAPWRQQIYNRSGLWYRILIANTDAELEYKRVVLEDDIPAGMSVNLSASKQYIYTLKDPNVSYDTGTNRTYIVNGTFLSTANSYLDAEVTKNADGTQHVRVTINKMKPGVYYDIRLSCSTAFSFTDMTYTNTAKVTSVNGTAVNKESNTVVMDGAVRYQVNYNYITKDAANKTIEYPPNGLYTPKPAASATTLAYDDAYTLADVSATADYKVINKVKTPGTWRFLGWYRSTAEAQEAYAAGAPTTKAISMNKVADFFDLSACVSGDYYFANTGNGATNFAQAVNNIAAIQDTDAGKVKLYQWNGGVVTTSTTLPTPWTYYMLPVYGCYIFEPTVYSISYVVNPDSTWGIPAGSPAVVDAHTNLAYLSNTTLKDALSTTVTYATSAATGTDQVPGVWTFTGWQDESGKAVTEVNGINRDWTVSGQWTFTPITYTLDYSVKADPVWGKPAADRTKATPAQVTGINWDGTVTLAAGLTTTDGNARRSDGENVPGVWSFVGWSADEAALAAGTTITASEHIKENRTVYGKWVFTPTTYNVHYQVAGDSTWGIPEGNPAAFDDASNPYDWKARVTLAQKQTTAWTTVSGAADAKPGTWAFSGWYTDAAYTYNAADFNITADKTLYGYWTFTGDTYTLDYAVKPDAVWGKPLESKTTATPAKVTDIAWDGSVTLAAGLKTTSVTSVRSDGETVPGVWSFVGWAADEAALTAGTTITASEHIKENRTVYGQWKFTPTTYNVSYQVEGDALYGIPEGNPASFDDTNNPYDWKDTVTVAPLQTTAWTTSDGTDAGMPGTWSFSTAWTTTDASVSGGRFSITRDTVLKGAWRFKPTLGSVKMDMGVVGVTADKNLEFTYTITLTSPVAGTNQTGTLTLPGKSAVPMTFVPNGKGGSEAVATVTLKGGNTKPAVLDGIPVGTFWKAEFVPDEKTGLYTITGTDNLTGTILAGEEAKLIHYEHSIAALDMTMNVYGNLCSDKHEFTYTITLKDANGSPVSGSYPLKTGSKYLPGTSAADNRLTFKDGTATVVLRDSHKELDTNDYKIIVDGLPVGASYTTECIALGAEGYSTALTCGNTLTPAAVEHIVYKHARRGGDLDITLKLKGNAIEKDRVFTYTVTLKESDGTLMKNTAVKVVLPGSKTETELTTNNNGELVVSLMDGQTMTVKYLPAGAVFSAVITQDNSSLGYAVEAAKLNNAAYAGTITGTIVEQGIQHLVYVHQRSNGYLTVGKTVEFAGSNTVPGRTFTLTITLKDKDGNNVTDTFSAVYKRPKLTDKTKDVTFVDGVAAVNLHHNETVTINNLPVLAAYEVNETNPDGYTVSWENERGTIPAGSGVTVKCINSARQTYTAYTVKKIWKDNDDEFEKRPDSVTITVKGSDGYRAELTLTEDNGWQAETEQLPTLDDDARQITYSFAEEKVPAGYQVSLKVEGTTITVTNTLPGADKPVSPEFGEMQIEDNTIPLGMGMNMNEGDCFE